MMYKVNNSIFDLIHEIDKNFIFKLKNEVKNILIDTKIEKVSMDITPVQQSENKNSFLFTFRRFKNIEESANSLRKSLVNLEFSAMVSPGSGMSSLMPASFMVINEKPDGNSALISSTLCVLAEASTRFIF